MKYALILALFATSVAVAQETFKCTIGGATVIQDRPCLGAVKRSSDMPVKSPQLQPGITTDPPQIDPVAAQRLKTERDKEYIAEQVKRRADERERDQAAERIQLCDLDAAEINQRISRIANSGPSGTPLNAVSAQVMMLDQQSRQTQIASLQAQASAKRDECNQMRFAFSQRWKK